MAAAPTPEAPTLRVALAGLGGRGQAWLAALASAEASTAGIALIGLRDPDPERALEALARVRRAVPVTADLNDLLDLGPDLVVNPEGVGTRLAVARAVLGGGAHLLCEPPLAADDETARALLGLSARAAGRLSVAHRVRPLAGVAQLRDLAASGRLGRPLTLRCEVRADRGEPAGAALHAALRGPALDAFDAARLVLGAEAVEVRCLERGAGGGADVPRRGGSEAYALFDLADGGVFAFTANLAEAGPADAGRWRLVLEAGAAHWDGEGPVRAWAAGGSREVAPPPVPAGPSPSPEIRLLLDAARGGGGAAAGARDAAASLAMALAAIRSARAGGRPEAVRPLGLATDRALAPATRVLARLAREAP